MTIFNHLKKPVSLFCALCFSYQLSAQTASDCNWSFKSLNKALEDLFTQNKDTSDLLKQLDTLIKEGEVKADANEAFMQASLRGDIEILKPIKQKYDLDTHTVIEYAFLRQNSTQEIDNLIQFLPISSPYVREKKEYVDQVFVQALIKGNTEIANHLITNHGALVDKALIQLVQTGDLKTVTQLVEQYGADIFYSPPNSYAQAHLSKLIQLTGLYSADLTPLNIASSLGHKDLVTYFLNQGKNSLAERADTAFLKAVEKGHTDSAKVFIEVLKNPIKTLETALIKRILEKPETETEKTMANFLIAEILKIVDRQNPPQAKELVKNSLHLAAKTGLLDKVKTLIQRQEISILDINQSGLNIALQNGHKDLARFLIQQLKHPYSDGLKIALLKGYGDIVKMYLFEKNFDLLTSAENFIKPLTEVAIRGQMEILKDFFKAGYKDKEFLNTVLPEVVLESRLKETELVKVIELLIGEGASLEGQNSFGETALHLAARMGKSLVVDSLIGHNANLNAINKNKESPLHAILYRDELWTSFLDSTQFLKIIQSLINHGADLTLKDYRGQTPLEVAKLKKIRKDFDIGDYGSGNYRSLKPSDYAQIILLENQGQLNLHNYDYKGLFYSPKDKEAYNSPQSFYTPLGFAIESRNAPLVKDLINLGADVYISPTNKKSISESNLEYAVNRYTVSSKEDKAQAKQIVDILLEKSNPQFRNQFGATDLMIVASGGTTKQVELLIQKEHDIHAKDKNGHNVADYAMLNQSAGPLQSLYNSGARITDADLLRVDFSIFKSGSGLKIEHTKVLIEGGFNVNQNINGMTLLHVATSRLDLKSVEFLLQNGAKMDIKSEWFKNKTARDLLTDRLELYKNITDSEAKERYQEALSIEKLFESHTNKAKTRKEIFYEASP